jgi:hypothetical protein
MAWSISSAAKQLTHESNLTCRAVLDEVILPDVDIG